MKLSTELDKTNNLVNLIHEENLGSTPVVPVFLKEYANLIDQGFAYKYLVATNKSNVIYAEIENKVAGFIIFDFHDDVAKTCWVIFGSVVEGFRQRGLYKMMHMHLEKIAKDNGSSQVFSFVHVNNHRMLEVSKQLNKHPAFYRVEKYL